MATITVKPENMDTAEVNEGNGISSNGGPDKLDAPVGCQESVSASQDHAADASHAPEAPNDENQTLTKARQQMANLRKGEIELGGTLKTLKQEQSYGEHSDFRTVCEKGLGITERKAGHLMLISDVLNETGAASANEKSSNSTKPKQPCSGADPDHLLDWAVVTESVTVDQLWKAIKQAADDGAFDDGIDDWTVDITFKVHQDQREMIEAAIDKMKKTSGTEYSAVALANLCGDWLTGTPGKDVHDLTEKQLGSRLKKLGLEKATALMESIWGG